MRKKIKSLGQEENVDLSAAEDNGRPASVGARRLSSATTYFILVVGL